MKSKKRCTATVRRGQHGVTMGGFIWFRKELEFLKSIWQIPLKLPIRSIIFLINTCRPAETTGEMVHYVRAKSKEQEQSI